MGLALGSTGGRWLVAASVLGSGLAFLDSTAVNVALPAIGRELGGGLGVQQWVLDGYLLTLSALLLLGGPLGDRYMKQPSASTSRMTGSRRGSGLHLKPGRDRWSVQAGNSLHVTSPAL